MAGIAQRRSNLLRNSLLAGTALFAAALPRPAQATSATWLNAPGTTDWNTGANWTGGVAPQASGDTATFGATTQTTVALSANTTVSVLNFGAAAPAYTINDVAHAFTVDGALGTPGFSNTSGIVQTLNVSNGSTATFGSATVNVSPVTLTNFSINASFGAVVNFASGSTGGAGTTVGLGGGTSLNVTGTGNLTNTNVVTSGGVLNISGAGGGVSVGALVSTSGSTEAVTLGANTLTVGFNNANNTFDGVISGTGGLTNVGTATLTLTGANTYSGATTINSGALSIGAANNLGTGAGGLVFGGGTLIDTTGLALTEGVTLNAGGGTISNSAGTTTLSGNITGIGALTKTGSANLILSGTNTYSGGTTILAGTVTLGSLINAAGSGPLTVAAGSTLNVNNGFQASSSLSGAGTINLGAGTLTTTGAANTAYSGTINGTGNFTMGGTGSLVLSGPNTYSGLTTINNGTLSISSGGNLGTGSSLIFNSGTLSTTAALALAQNVTLNTAGTVNTVAGNTGLTGVLSGNGQLIKTGAATLVLSGANTYTGGTLISGGILQGNTTSIQGNVANNANLTFNQNTNGTYNSAISGTGTLAKIGTNILTLDQANSFTGQTTIANGELIVGDATHEGASIGGSATVLGNAILRGHGTIGGSVLNNGMISPGASIGTLTINGNYGQSSNGALYSEIAPTTNSVLAVNGSAALAGTLILAPENGAYTPYTRYALLTAANGVTGTFANVIDTAPGVVGFSLSYLPNSVVATSLPSYTFAGRQAALGASSNNIRTAAALDAAYPTAGGDFRNVINSVYFTTPQQQQNTLSQLSGEMRSNFATVNVANVTALHDTLMNRLDSRTGLTTAASNGNGMPNQFQVASQDTDDMGPLWGPASSNPYLANDGVSTWIRGFGNFGDAGSYQGSTPFQYQTGGVIAGADKKLSDSTLLGAAVSYDHTNIGSSLDESGNIDSYRIMVYGDQAVGPVMVDGNVGYGYSTYHDQRSLVFPGVSRSATSSHDGNDYTADLGVSHTFKDVDTAGMLPGKLALEPRIGAEYIGIDQDSYSEGNANSIGLDTQTRDLNAFRSTVGGKAVLDLPATERGTAISPELHLAWLHDFADVNQTVTQNFTAAPGTPFTVEGVRPGRDAALVGTGLTVAFNQQSSLFADYDAAVRDRETDHTISAGFRYKW